MARLMPTQVGQATRWELSDDPAEGDLKDDSECDDDDDDDDEMESSHDEYRLSSYVDMELLQCHHHQQSKSEHHRFEQLELAMREGESSACEIESIEEGKNSTHGLLLDLSDDQVLLRSKALTELYLIMH